MVKENAVFIARAKQGVRAVNVQKTKLPDRFLGRVFKSKVREGSCRVCDKFVHSCLIGSW